jgi:hypothetical protein
MGLCFPGEAIRFAETRIGIGNGHRASGGLQLERKNAIPILAAVSKTEAKEIARVG